MQVSFRSPCPSSSSGVSFVRVRVPQDTTLAEVRKGSEAAKKGYQILLSGSKGVSDFADFPLGREGAVGLLVLTMALAGEEAQKLEPTLLGILGGYSYSKQCLEKFGEKILTEDMWDSCVQAVKSFDDKYGPVFRSYAAARVAAFPDRHMWKVPVLRLLKK
jgi:hypothetical protein